MKKRQINNIYADTFINIKSGKKNIFTFIANEIICFIKILFYCFYEFPRLRWVKYFSSNLESGFSCKEKEKVFFKKEDLGVD